VTTAATLASRGGTDDMAWIPSATFRMGSDAHYAEEAPSHHVTVDGFWIDRHEVTNRQFAAFVDDTGYVTVAERPLDPLAFRAHRRRTSCQDRWSSPGLAGRSTYATSTCGGHGRRGRAGNIPKGRRPHSPAGRNTRSSTSPTRTRAPTPHGAGKALPTESQWELAARGGLEAAVYGWGDEPEPADAMLANYWHGDFPWRAEPGYGTTAPVGSYPPNGHGLFDTAGNVWEWTADWYTARHPEDADKPCCVPHNPRGGREQDSIDYAQPQFAIARKVIKGGSFLCADSYCLRYRPAARRPQMIDTGMSHIGFRCARDPKTPDLGGRSTVG
jgi:formylglycine-generating enzyme